MPSPHDPETTGVHDPLDIGRQGQAVDDNTAARWRQKFDTDDRTVCCVVDSASIVKANVVTEREVAELEIGGVDRLVVFQKQVRHRRGLIHAVTTRPSARSTTTVMAWSPNQRVRTSRTSS